jgi:hypothetical protein
MSREYLSILQQRGDGKGGGVGVREVLREKCGMIRLSIISIDISM